jgi:uncharacterized SAM-binding protein YcdF (DUF218 family)
MSYRRRHREALLRDADALHALAVAGVALVLSGGLLYLAYLGHALRVARRAPVDPGPGGTLLVFGKRSLDGRPDADFQARLARAHALLRAEPGRGVLLLGGGPPGATEAVLAARALAALGLPEGCVPRLEDQSRDTLENLRNARALLAADPAPGAAPVVLLSSRYHLARCALFARGLGIDHRLCAAEPALGWRPAVLARLAAEAAYLLWVDVGQRWAALIGHRRMLARLR